jgi:hypothetical protein
MADNNGIGKKSKLAWGKKQTAAAKRKPKRNLDPIRCSDVPGVSGGPNSREFLLW